MSLFLPNHGGILQMSTNICLLNNHHLAIGVWTRFYCQMCDEPQRTGWTYDFCLFLV